jgi:hypothetical protein
MVTEEPQVPRLRDRLVRRLGHVIGVDEAVLRLGRCQGRQHRRQGLGADRHLGEELAQLGLVGGGHRGERIEGGEDEPLLVLRQVDVQDGDGRLAVGERLIHPEVAVDEVPRALVDDDLGDVADRVQHLAQGFALGLRMDPPVAGVGEQLVGSLLAGAHDPVGPSGGGGHGRARHVQVVA